MTVMRLGLGAFETVRESQDRMLESLFGCVQRLIQPSWVGLQQLVQLLDVRREKDLHITNDYG